MRPNTRRILCVDDDSDTCAMLKALFELEGYEVLGAGGTGEAVRLAEAVPCDLFVLDTRFPEGSGLDLCRVLKAISPGTPIIIYSGAASDADRAAGLAAGAMAYVGKPDIEHLVNAVRLAFEAG